MSSRTALITGVLGQDGSLLAELLLSRGYRVVGVARPGAVVPSDGPLAPVVFAEVDLLDPLAVRALLAHWEPDELYHLAAFHHSSQDNPTSAALAGKEAMVQTNFGSTKTLAFALVDMRAPCHLVFASSSQIYTATNLQYKIDEQSTRCPSTFYGHTKAWSMELLDFLRRDSGLRASSAILFNHESPRRGAQFVSRKITRAAAQAAMGERPSLTLGNIGARVDWSSAHDVVEALSRMGRSEASQDHVIASGVSRSVRDFLQTAFGARGLDWARYTSFEDDRATPSLVGDTGLLRSRLDWTPKVNFGRMVEDLVACDMDALRQSISYQ